MPPAQTPGRPSSQCAGKANQGLRRAVRRAAAYAGDTGGLDRTIAVLRQARLAESRGDSRVADILLTEALNAMNGTE